MTRDQALNLVKIYDNSYPEQFLDQYLDYYEMKKDESYRFRQFTANAISFKKINGRWVPKFEPS